MNALAQAILRLGALAGGALALYHAETTQPAKPVNCHQLTSSDCLQLVIKHSLVAPTTHALLGPSPAYSSPRS